MLDEKKGTCCHKCGHVHVKGTACPKPYLTGEKSCARKQNEGLKDPEDNPCWRGYKPVGTKMKDGKEVPNCVPIDEMHTADHDGPDEFHQVRADVEEISQGDYRWDSIIDYFKSSENKAKAAADIINYDFNPSDKFKYINLYSKLDPEQLLAKIQNFLSDEVGREEIRDLAQVLNINETVDETDQYCEACLAEYLLEYENKLEEAEYRGRKVSLGKPFLTPGGPKKRSVYVKNAKGNVVKVNFGDPNLRIKKNIPARRKAFRARHKCDNPGPRWKAGYWSCKAW